MMRTRHDDAVYASVRRVLAALAMLALTTAGCTRHRHLAFDPARPRPMTAADARAPWRSPPPTPASVAPVEVRRGSSPRTGYRRVFVSTRSVTDNGQPGNAVTGAFWSPEAAGRHPLVLVLPIWGSSRYPPRKLSRRLTDPARGVPYNILWLDGDETLFDWQRLRGARFEPQLDAALAHWVAAVEGTVVDVRRLLDWALAQPSVDGDRVAQVGFSIGAIVGAVIHAYEPRIGSAVYVTPGAHLHEVLRDCRGKAAAARRQLQDRFGWTRDELARRYAEGLAAIEPVRFLPALDPARVLVIEAAKDDCIPPSARTAFLDALGQPERLAVPYGHRTSYLAMTFLGGHLTTDEAVRFLDRQLARRAGDTPADAVARRPR